VITAYDKVAGEMFKQVRKKLQKTSGVKDLFTQETMAARMGCTQAWVSKMETGHAGISMEECGRLCNALGLKETDVNTFLHAALSHGAARPAESVRAVLDSLDHYGLAVHNNGVVRYLTYRG